MYMYINLHAQKDSFLLRTNSSFYRIKNGKSQPFKIEFTNNLNLNVEILDVLNMPNDSNNLSVRTYAEIYYKKDKKYKDCACKFDSYPVGGLGSKISSLKKIIINTTINPDCILFKGDYKVRLWVNYQFKGSNGFQRISSNWFYLKVYL